MIRRAWTLKHTIGVCVLLFAPLVFLHAQTTDSFTIQTLVGTDTAAPTVPGNFSATPVSTTQINLDWDASSDNFAVTGYQVFRDAVQIATTTLTSYNDTGLTPSTTYTYYVTAFDAVPNISSSTASIATTTLGLTPTSTPTSTPSVSTSATRQGFRRVLVQSIETHITEHAVEFTFTTNVPTRAIIRWGRTKNYESGSIAIDAVRSEHYSVIDGLESGTIYEIEIYLVDAHGRMKLYYPLTIETKEGPDTLPPPNVTELEAVYASGETVLTWQNPEVPDFSRVRVLSSDYFYPTHEADGWLVYDGPLETAVDLRAIPPGSKRYYTVFAYDATGNMSSGAVASVERGGLVREDGVDTVPLDERPTTTDGVRDDTYTYITFGDVIFTQNNIVQRVQNNTVALRGGLTTTIAVPYELMPQHLKAIVVTLKHPDDSGRVFSFLLRINARQTAYEAEIGPLLQAGRYATQITLYDFKTNALYSTEGMVLVTETSSEDSVSMVNSFMSRVQHMPRYVLAGVFFVVLSLLCLFVYRRSVSRREDSGL